MAEHLDLHDARRRGFVDVVRVFEACELNFDEVTVLEVGRDVDVNSRDGSILDVPDYTFSVNNPVVVDQLLWECSEVEVYPRDLQWLHALDVEVIVNSGPSDVKSRSL